MQLDSVTQSLVEFCLVISRVRSCVDFTSIDDKEQIFSTSTPVGQVYTLTSQGCFLLLDWKGKCEPSHMILITLAPTFRKTHYNIQNNYLMPFCVLHSSLPLKLVSYIHANDMIFFFPAVQQFYLKDKR